MFHYVSGTGLFEPAVRKGMIRGSTLLADLQLPSEAVGIAAGCGGANFFGEIIEWIGYAAARRPELGMPSSQSSRSMPSHPSPYPAESMFADNGGNGLRTAGLDFCVMHRLDPSAYADVSLQAQAQHLLKAFAIKLFAHR